MRSAIFAVLLSLTILAVAGVTLMGEQAVAQQSRGSGHGKGKDKNPEPPPPPPRCPDLALSTYQFLSQGTDGAPLPADQVAIQWSINNAGNAAYQTGDTANQTLVLEYMSPSGSHQVATQPVPSGLTPAAATEDSPGGFTLGQGQSWRGVLRTTLPPEAQRRRLRLVLTYLTDGYHPANDCDLGNNEMDLMR
jgi:hypothetical protein